VVTSVGEKAVTEMDQAAGDLEEAAMLEARLSSSYPSGFVPCSGAGVNFTSSHSSGVSLARASF
jgi:hypothetical protein